MPPEPVGHVAPERRRDAGPEEAEVPDPLGPELLGRDQPALLSATAVLRVERLDRERRRERVVHEPDREDRRRERAVPRPVTKVGWRPAPPRPLQRDVTREVLAEAEEPGREVSGGARDER